MNPVYRIHPAIGIARVGNAVRTAADDWYFIGPEVVGIPSNFDPATGRYGSFKLNGKIKPQAARFRVFEYLPDATGRLIPGREINLDADGVVSLTWKVTLANRKATFFNFDGQLGVADDFATNGRRNDSLKDAHGQKIPDADLELEETASVSGRAPQHAPLDNHKAQIPIQTLGELRTDQAGRLIVLGGRGDTNALTDPAANPPAPFRLRTYANNPGWFDDISDGPVSAELKMRLADGTTVALPVEGSWVLVGPPDFAPSVGNPVTLYDTLWDVAARKLTVDPNDGLYDTEWLARLKKQNTGFSATGQFPADYQPSYALEIVPILLRGYQMGWVHADLNFGPNGAQDHHRIFRPANLNQPVFSNPAQQAPQRHTVFTKLQAPGTNQNGDKMPRSLGDEPYKSALPQTRLLTFTRVQYEVMNQWQQNKFENLPVFQPDVPPFGNGITPWGLDRAALEACVGGAFYPGIEASWLLRQPGIYSAPFRIQLGAQALGQTVRAGFFSQQMAQPWKADFLDCKAEEGADHISTTTRYGWWPGQRPDETFVGPNATAMEQWARGTLELAPANTAADIDRRYRSMVTGWSNLGFVIAEKDRHFEVEGPPSTAPAPPQTPIV